LDSFLDPLSIRCLLQGIQMKNMTESTETRGQAAKAMTDREGKYLTFSLAHDEYGIKILKIREIIGMMPVTAIPMAPPFVRGVINLRGKVIPVVDLRLRLGMQEIDYTERTCIIVIEAQASHMEKCWETKNCNKKDCPAYKNMDLRCWIISGTFCRDEVQGSYHEKIEACRKCEFYRSANEQAAVLTMGIVVDSVSEVINIKTEEIEDPPTFGTKLNIGYILGMAKIDGVVKILLDIDYVLNAAENVISAISA
jgi:chemotaxis signal transduction protein